MPNTRKYFPKTYVCETCKKEFVRTSGHIYRFCCPRCRALAKGRNLIKHICEWCSKEFENWPSRPGRFCSIKCAGAFGCRQKKKRRVHVDRGGKVTWSCKQCGKEMRTFKSRVQDCCSQKCAYLYWPKKMKANGDHHPNWRGGAGLDRGVHWHRTTKEIRERDGYTCQSCWKFGIDVHHIVPYREFNGDWENANQPSNLITLCHACHMSIEHNKKPCPIPIS